jgi:ketosteroid isomerase-like protein
MFRYLLRLPMVLTVFLFLPQRLSAQEAPATGDSVAVTELRAAIRQYDDALRRRDVAALEKFWSPDYTFVNPRGERLTRADRLANARSGRTALDSLAHAPKEQNIRIYGDREVMAVHTGLLTVGGRYSGRPERGQFRVLVVWVRRDGRWQQVASQMTPVVAP